MENKKGKIALNDDLLGEVSGGMSYSDYVDGHCHCANPDPDEDGICKICGQDAYRGGGRLRIF